MKPQLGEAFALIEDYVMKNMQATGIPGMAVAVTDRKGLLWSSTYGVADVEHGLPIASDMRFQIGSIGKSFASIALLQLQEKGELSVHDPVTEYLPWLKIKTRFEPITLRHLMSHTGGITNGTDSSATAHSEALVLRELATSVRPGTFFHYSNTGYKILGLVLEAVTGKPNWQVLEENVIGPLGMTSTEAKITNDNRALQPVGYGPQHDDRPHPHCGKLSPAHWLVCDTADGSVISTPGDMAAYVRMLLNRGRGPKGRIMSARSFGLLTSKAIRPTDYEHGEYYGLGLNVGREGGHLYIGHSGGMPGFISQILADMDEGVGVVVLNNSRLETHEIARFSLKVMRAALHGRKLPPLPTIQDVYVVENAKAYAGTYRARGKKVRIQLDRSRLLLVTGPDSVVLERRGKDVFYANHPCFDKSLLRFGRQKGRVVEFFCGGDWYRNESYKRSRSFPHPRSWNAYLGHYRSHNPWYPSLRVVLRKGKLTLMLPEGGEEPLLPVEEGGFRMGARKESPERLTFRDLVKGRAQTLVLSGGEWGRISIE